MSFRDFQLVPEAFKCLVLSNTVTDASFDQKIILLVLEFFGKFHEFLISSRRF